MKEIYELYALTNKQHRIVEALLPRDPGSPLVQLAKIVLDGEELSDEECMHRIYGKKNKSAYFRVKQRLKDIISYIVTIEYDIPRIATKDTSNMKVSHDFFFARALHSRQKFKEATEVLEKSINRAIKFGHSDIVFLQARSILYIVGSSHFNKYKFQKYTKLLDKYLNIYQWEIKAEQYYLDLQRTHVLSVSYSSKEYSNRAKKYIKELEKANDIDSNQFLYNLNRIKYSLYESTKDYNNAYILLDRMIKSYEKSPITTDSELYNTYVRYVFTLIQMGRLDDAINFCKSRISRIPQGTNSDYRIKLYLIKAYIYKGNYKEAIILVTKLLNLNAYKYTSSYYKEIYPAINGYLQLVIDSGVAGDLKEYAETLPEFRLAKFLNNTPVYSKDKRGFNISIILLHIAYLLKRKDYNSIIDRIDSLSQYAYRYLRKDDTLRNNCMIKMVVQMAKADFHPVRTERYVAELKKQMMKAPLYGSGENVEIEMIPFEVLWEIMMKSLED